LILGVGNKLSSRVQEIPAHDAIHPNYYGIHVIFLHYLYGSTASSGPGNPHFRGFTIILRHITLGRTPPNELSARRRDRYLHNTQQTQQTKIHSISGIRTRDPRQQAASYLRPRPQGHRDRQFYISVLTVDYLIM